MCRQLSASLQKIAETELNEDSTRLQDDLESIRQWLKKQPHLNFDIEDQILLSFLRCSKFRLERTKEKIDNYYTMRTFAAEALTNRDPLLPEIQLLLSAGLILPLPKALSNDGCRLIMYSCGDNLNPDTMSVSNIAKVAYMVLDILVMEDDRCVVSGIKMWMTCKNTSPKYVPQLTFSQLKKYLTIFQNGIPIRISELYVTDCSPLFQYAYDIAKLVLNKKLRNRLSMYSNSDSEEFCNRIPQILQPNEFGGENGSMKELIVEWKRKVESYRDWFMEDEKRRSNEDLRQGAPKTISHLFGMEGSFRKLNVD